MRPDFSKHLQKLSPTADYLVREFVDNYEDGVMSRRDMLERIFRITGSTAATASVLLALGVTPAHSDPLASASFQAPPPSGPMSPFTVAENDPAIIAGPTTFPSGSATIMAYWARPRAAGRSPAVMICHENQGMAEHFKDVSRRFAKAGYVAIALDLLSRQGGTDAVPENERGAGISGPGAAERHVADFQAAMAYLRQQPFVLADRIGMIGFCFGGGVTWNVAIKEPSLRAGAAYYGNPAFRDELPNMRAAMLGAYGERDERTTTAGLSLEPDLAAARKTYRLNVYPGAGHAFFNDTRPNSYLESAATAAWRDTLAWFSTYLRVGVLPGTGSAEVSPAGDLAEETVAE